MIPEVKHSPFHADPSAGTGMISPRVKWGVMSTSSTATAKAIPALLRSAGAELIAIASRDLVKAERFAVMFGIRNFYGSYTALLEDREVEAIYVPLPNAMHAEWSIRAAMAGKHVLCEKPAALTPQDAEDIIATCRQNRVAFMEGFPYRFHPQLDYVQRCLAANLIGRVLMARISFSFMLEERHSRIRLQRSLGGGALADLGTYCIDLSRLLIGTEPLRVFASGNCSQGADVETSFAAVLDFPDGRRAVLDGAFDQPRNNRCEIVGQLGTIIVESPFIANGLTIVRIDSPHGKEHSTFSTQNLFQLEFEHFSHCLITHSRPTITAEGTIANARTLAALQKSIDLGQAVEIRPITGPNSYHLISSDQIT